MVRKVLLYLLPLYLYVLEVLIKTIAATESESLLGTTLAGAGIGFMLPLTELKKVDAAVELKDYLVRMDAFVYSKNDKTLIDVVWFIIFLSLLGWMYALFLTIKPEHSRYLSPNVIGSLIFMISVSLCEIKERV